MSNGHAPRDTSFEVTRELAAIWRDKTPQERFAALGAMLADVETLARAGILAANPDLNESEMVKELARRRYGSRLVSDAWGGSDTTK